jgi:hypothetical protein
MNINEIKESVENVNINETEENVENHETKESAKNLMALWEKYKTEGLPDNPVTVKPAGHKGLGVFAKRDIKSGEWVELCYSVKLNWKKKYVSDSGILQYAYWDNSCRCQDCRNHGAIGLLALGAGSIYNCAENKEGANLEYIAIAYENLVAFIATKDVPAGEELLTWWGEGYFNQWCRPKPKQ